MPTTYQPAPQTVIDQAQRLIEAHHARLMDAKVKIDFLFAHASVDDDTGDPTGPAIKVSGIPAWGYCRIINLRDRAKGMGDVEIAVDGDKWGSIDQEQQDAILDHELTHIALVKGKTDDLGRPKVKMRDHDWEFGTFDECAARHGAASYEVQMMRQMQRESPVYFQQEFEIVERSAA